MADRSSASAIASARPGEPTFVVRGPADGSPLIIACGMIAREVIAVRELCGLGHIELRCLPAEWHFEPDRIVPALRRIVGEARRDGPRDIFVGYADCGTGGRLHRACEELGVEALPGPHCFATYQGAATFEAARERDMASFYVTDFLARQPDAFLWRPLGLERHPELIADYFGAYERVVHLAQADDPALQERAAEIAARLALPLETRHTGYGDLTALLAAWGAAGATARSPA